MRGERAFTLTRRPDAFAHASTGATFWTGLGYKAPWKPDPIWHKDGTPVLRPTQTYSGQHGASNQVIKAETSDIESEPLC